VGKEERKREVEEKRMIIIHFLYVQEVKKHFMLRLTSIQDDLTQNRRMDSGGEEE